MPSQSPADTPRRLRRMSSKVARAEACPSETFHGNWKQDHGRTGCRSRAPGMDFRTLGSRGLPPPPPRIPPHTTIEKAAVPLPTHAFALSVRSVLIRCRVHRRLSRADYVLLCSPLALALLWCAYICLCLCHVWMLSPSRSSPQVVCVCVCVCVGVCVCHSLFLSLVSFLVSVPGGCN